MLIDKKIKAIAITRVSTKSQCDSLEVQMQAINAYCENHPELEIVNIHKLKESAFCLKAGDLDDIIGKTKDNFAIIISKVDRLTRNINDFYVFAKMVREHNITFHIIREGIVWNKDSGRDIENTIMVLIAHAERESIQISERTIDCLRICREMGKAPYRAPFGYINYTEGSETGIKLHEANSIILKELFQLYSSGNFSLEMLSKHVQRKYGIHLSKQRIDYILRNNFYIGYAYYETVKYKHIYKTIIDEAVFNKCLEILNGNRKVSKKPTKQLVSPLRGLVRDKETKALFTPYVSRHKTVNYLKTKVSGTRNLKESDIINALSKGLKQLNDRTDIVSLLDAQINADNITELANISKCIANEKKEIKRFEERIQNLLTGNAYGATPDMIAASIEKLNKQLSTHRGFLQQYQSREKEIKQDTVIITMDILQSFNNMGIESKHNMLKILFKNIIYHNNSITCYFQDGLGIKPIKCIME